MTRKYTKAAQRSTLQISFAFDAPSLTPATPHAAPTNPAPATRPAAPARRADLKTFATLPAALRARDQLILTRWAHHAATAPSALTAQLARNAARLIVRAATKQSQQSGASALRMAVAAATSVQDALATWAPGDAPASGPATLPASASDSRRLARLHASARRIAQRVTRRSHTTGNDGQPIWNTQTLEADLASLRAHWDALVLWLTRAIDLPGYPEWTYHWRTDTTSWVMRLQAPTRHRPTTAPGARVALRTRRTAA